MLCRYLSLRIEVTAGKNIEWQLVIITLSHALWAIWLLYNVFYAPAVTATYGANLLSTTKPYAIIALTCTYFTSMYKYPQNQDLKPWASTHSNCIVNSINIKSKD